jgi:hypothetical protein
MREFMIFQPRLLNAASRAVFLAVCAFVLPTGVQAAETCTTQSQMTPADRTTLAGASTRIALAVQSGDTSALRAEASPDLQAGFSAVSSLVESTAPELRGAEPQPRQLYILDASTLVKTASGTNPNAQFYCPLMGTQDEADFSIPQLPPARYAFAMVDFPTAAPMRLSLLLQQVAGQWKLAGLYPRSLSAEGHDGLWFWTQARTYQGQKQSWNAWLYLGEAQQLLTPAGFVSSTHLDKLAQERMTDAPPVLTQGLSAQTPLVIKAADGTEYRFTSLSTGTYTPGTLDLEAHYSVEALGDGIAARHRNDSAAAALLSAHPELRTAFHGVWVFADLPTGSPYGTEQTMAEMH